MKDYKSYMDRVTVSKEMREKLMALERGKKEEKPMKWKTYAAAAACAALLIGVGVWGVGARPEEERWRDLVATFETAAVVESTQISDPDPVQCAAPSAPVESQEAIDLAPEDPSGAEPGIKTIEGYETRETRAGVDVAVYHVLPWIDYGGGSLNAGQVSADWDIPQNASRRNLTGLEIIYLLGGQDAVNLHLDWSDYELTGWGAWYEDGSFWGAYLMGYKGPMDHFEFAVTSGQLPPTCVVFGDSVEQEVWGLTVTADKYDGKDGASRRVSFMKDDYGYRFDLTATGDPEDAEKLVSRAVTWIANGDGLNFSAVTPAVVRTREPESDHTAILPLEDGAGAPDSESQPPSPPPQDEASAPSVPPAASVSPEDGASSPAWYPEGVEVLPPEEIYGD